MRDPSVGIPVLRYAVAVSMLAACQAEPSEPSEVVTSEYRLASVDDQVGRIVPCFASTSFYVEGQLIETRDCNVALQDLRVRFDSTRSPAELVATAKVIVDGRDTTWEASAPVLVANDVFRIREGSVPFDDFPPEARYILPGEGSVLGVVLTSVGAMTTGIPSPFAGSAFTGTKYAAPRRRLMIWTPTGRRPHATPMAGQYIGYSFSGQPTSGSNCPPDLGMCFPYVFASRLVASGHTWDFEYRAGGPDSYSTIGISGLVIKQAGAFVEVVQGVPGDRAIIGSVVGKKLTLFPRYSYGFDRLSVTSPILFDAQ